MNTSRKRSSNNKVSVFIMAPLRTAGLVLCVWLSCQPGGICAQQIAGQEPETAISSTGPKTPYEEYQSLANQRQQNMQEINRLYATMPIGVVEAQAAQRAARALAVAARRCWTKPLSFSWVSWSFWPSRPMPVFIWFPGSVKRLLRTCARPFSGTSCR